MIAAHGQLDLDVCAVYVCQVLEFLCKPGDDSHKEERQEALLELLNVEKQLQIDVDHILVMAEHANLYVVLLMY